MIRIPETHRVEIRQEEGFTQVYVDGVRIKRVREIDFHQSVDEAPTVELNIYGAPTMNIDAFIELRASADEFLAWLDKRIKESEGDVKDALMECRRRYVRLLGG